MIQREFAHIPLSQLVVTDINMRHEKKTPDIADILPSIRQRGILQSLLVRRHGDQYEVAAGRRRYFSLKAIGAETGEDVTAPCLVLEAGDDAAAIEASLLENVARQDTDEMTQYEVYVRLIREGKTSADIAGTFGIETSKVEKRLALGRLDHAIHNLYRQGSIGVEEIRALTLASPRQQKEWLKLHKTGKQPPSYQLKKWICGGSSISAEAAIFALEDYKGEFASDLFEGDRYFCDTAAFWELQNAAIAARRDKYLSKGWKVVETLDLGRRFDSWQFERAAKKDGAKIIVETHSDGSVKFHEGYLSKADAKRAKARAKGEDSGEAAAPLTDKAELTQPQTAYINAHRQAAARAALVQNPTIAFRLMVAHAIAGNHNFRVSEDREGRAGDGLAESLAGNGCHQMFGTAQAEALALLGIDAMRSQQAKDEAQGFDELNDIEDEGEDMSFRPASKTTLTGHHGLTGRVFAKLLQLDDSEVMQITAVIMAEALAAGSEAVEVIAVQTGASLAGQWKPDALFWDQCRDKEIIGAMLSDVAGREIADTKVTATGKAKKAIIQATLADGQHDTWLPRWLAETPTSYTNRNGFRTPQHHGAAKALLAV